MNPAFRERAANTVEVIPTDFQNPEGFNTVFNRWAQQKTKGTINQIRANFPPSTRMVMSSAVYFKGEWIFKFNPAQPGEFLANGNRPITANMMTLKKKVQYGKIGDMAEWIAVPYESASDVMIIVLPSKSANINQVMQNLNIDQLFIALDQDNNANVNITLPKFKIESTYSLSDAFKNMGMQRMFTQNAEINQLILNENLEVSQAMQQASLEVNEEGSIATSLTSFSVVALSFSPPIPDVEFTVDRPFIAMIADKKRFFPYFIAKVMSP